MDATRTIDIGADVVSSDEERLGKVEYVVVRPADMRVMEIVVRTGTLLGRDIVVPVDRIREVQDGTVFLSIDKDELKKYPDYIEIDYQKPPTDWVPPEGLDRASGSILWPAGDRDLAASGLRVNAPPGTLGVREGMDVESSDGHRVGAVDALDIDLATREISGFVVKHGFLFKRDTRIPVGDVEMLRAGKVILKLTRDQVKVLELEQSQRND